MGFSVGDVVGGYRIESVLGAGGMGIVYRAANPTLPRSDALKVLGAEFSRDQQFRARFQREADVAATLDHPNIVAVYSRGETDDGQLWIAMQYVAGSDADKELEAGTMTPTRAAAIITEVAKALDFAHRRGILHRDVKPANFLISPAEHASDDERVFLADFGIARALDDVAHLTTDGSVMASVAYASPEALSGMAIDHRADIYSLGCSMFRMLTGRTPFGGRSGGLPAMAAAHMNENPPRVSDMVPGLPRALDAVIAKAMAKDPWARYGTAREFADAATAAVADATTAIPPQSAVTAPWEGTPSRPSTASRPPAPSRPPQAGWTSGPQRGPSAPIPSGPVPSGYMVGPHQTPTERRPVPPPVGGYPPGPPPRVAPTAPPPKPSRRRLLAGAGALIVVALVAIAATVLLSGGDTPETSYTAQTFTHAHGSTEVTAAPKAVAALGPGDADAVLALGAQPVAVLSEGGSLPSWLKDKLTDSPPVMGFIDTNAIASAKPDLIIATGDVDDATYEKLTAIAPTITQPADESGAWDWQAQLKWIAKILGKDTKGDELLATIAAQQNDLKNQNGHFVGKNVSVVNVSDTGISMTLSPSNAASFLGSLGFSYAEKLARQPGETGVLREVVNRSELYLIESDVMIVVRTDKVAGGGGAAGLPKELDSYRGVMVIVDDPDTVAALNQPGGVLATQFLDADWVPTLVDRVV